MIYFTSVASPLGELVLSSSGEKLNGLYLKPERFRQAIKNSPAGKKENRFLEIFSKTIEELNEYFHEGRTEFSLALDLSSGTGFQQRVWSELQKIPYGTAISYLELAKKVGDRNACRAVGMANGRNPISIVIPCHRVIGSDGSLTGYAGGLEAKKHLLRLEASSDLKLAQT